jgi:hypothetical protein
MKFHPEGESVMKVSDTRMIYSTIRSIYTAEYRKLLYISPKGLKKRYITHKN